MRAILLFIGAFRNLKFNSPDYKRCRISGTKDRNSLPRLFITEIQSWEPNSPKRITPYVLEPIIGVPVEYDFMLYTVCLTKQR